MYPKKNDRSSFRPNRRYSFKKNTSFSNHKNRLKGNISQLYDKYLKLAKASSSSGDRVQAEYYFQFADHYSRIMFENGIKSYENPEINEEINEERSKNSSKNIENSSQEDADTEKDLADNGEVKNVKEENENMEDSIESVSFISQEIKKTVKPKKKQ